MENNCFFSVRSITQTQLIDGYKIVVTTNIPVHLYMRWTTVKPQYHTVPIYRRGLLMHGDRYVCFVAYKENEQEEAGDTLEHTFVKVNWPDCQTRWFYFWGMVGALVCRSTSAVFEKHFKSPGIYDSPPCWHNRFLYSSHGTWSTARNGFNVYKTGQYQRPDTQLIVSTSLNASYWLNRAYLNFHTIAVPSDKIIIAAQLGLFITAKTGLIWGTFITKGLWDEPVTSEDWALQTEERVFLGVFREPGLIAGQYNWADFTPAGLDWLNESALKEKQWESYDWRKTAYFQVYGNKRWSQNFTPVYGHRLRTLKLRLKGVGDAGMFYIDIFDTTPNGCPTGDSLANDYSYAIMLSTDTWGDWHKFILNQPIWVEAGHTYVIVLRSLAGDASNRIDWIGSTGTPYPNGHACYSIDDGASWTAYPAYACYFIEYEVVWMNGVIPSRYKVGGTNLCLRTDFDITDSPPGAGVKHEIQFYSAQKGGDYKPLLRIYLGEP